MTWFCGVLPEYILMVVPAVDNVIFSSMLYVWRTSQQYVIEVYQ